MLFGELPFHNGIQDCHNLKFTEAKKDSPNDSVNVPHSDAFETLVKALLAKEPESRIGYRGGASEIFAHPWFTDTQQPHYIDIDMVL